VTTVVIPTVDRVDLLRRCLSSLPGVDVLVVHDGHAGIRALLAELNVAGLQIVERGVSAKRNAGWRQAPSDRVAFTDDDCEPMPGWLEALTAVDADLVAGPVIPHPDDPTGGRWDRTVTSTTPGFYPGCNLLVRKVFLEQVGGFDTDLHGGEDTDLVCRVRKAGAVLGWSQAATVRHAVRPQTFAEQLRSLPRWAGLPRVVGRHPELRALAHRRWFWKASHPLALLALLSLLGGLRDRRALLGAAPLLLTRARRHGLRGGVEVAVNDVLEVGVLAAGSLRHGSVLL
jgi:glycosyltransferase involved in cell wall biosynthesis